MIYESALADFSSASLRWNDAKSKFVHFCFTFLKDKCLKRWHHSIHIATKRTLKRNALNRKKRRFSFSEARDTSKNICAAQFVLNNLTRSIKPFNFKMLQ